MGGLIEAPEASESEMDVEGDARALPASAVEIVGEERSDRGDLERSTREEEAADGARSSGDEGRRPRAPADIVVVFVRLAE